MKHIGPQVPPNEKGQGEHGTGRGWEGGAPRMAGYVKPNGAARDARDVRHFLNSFESLRNFCRDVIKVDFSDFLG